MADLAQNDSNYAEQHGIHSSNQQPSERRHTGSQNRYAHLVAGKAPVGSDLAGAKPRVAPSGYSNVASGVGGQPHQALHNIALDSEAGAGGYSSSRQQQIANDPANHQVSKWHNGNTGTSQVHQKAPPLATAAGLNLDKTAATKQQPHQQQQHQNQNHYHHHHHHQHHHQKPDNYYYSSFSTVDWREQWLMLKEKTLEKVEEPECQRKLIMLIVCTALLLDNMLYMVIVPIIPDYLRSIGAWSTYTENAKWIRRNMSHGRSQWEQVGGQVIYEGEDSAVGFLFASKAIVQLIANPFSGAIADRIGYEIPMMFGLVVMFLSTMVFACGQTYSVLFLARSLQGVGSAFADTPGIAMLADRFTEEKERRRAQGIAIAFISFGCLVAPPFGSVLYQGAGKEVPFIILSLVCLVDSSLLFLVAPPGTFSQLWPSNYGGAGRRQNPPDGLGSTRPAPTASCKPSPDHELQQQGPGASRLADNCQPVTQSTSAAATNGEASSPSRPANLEAAEAASSGPAGGQMDKRRALYRQKSISRRHSMTVSAGEAPRGTPIEVLLKDKCIACCAGALVVANISLAFLEPTISIWVKNTMPDTEEWQEGMIWLPAFFPHVLGVFSTLHVAEKYPRSTWMIATAGLVIEGLGCLVVPFCSSFWSLIIPISIICFGVALIDTAILPTLGYLVDTRFTSVYGNVYAIADISYSVSYAIGPIIAGGIVEAIGFTALNFLIAVVTLGYTPSLMMLRSIHDYEPFEADPSGLAADRAKPFGHFGRAPIEELDEEEEDDDDDDDDPGADAAHASAGQYAAQAATSRESVARPKSSVGGVHKQQSATRYESPAWASGGAGQARHKSSSSGGAARQAKSVTIVEDPSLGAAADSAAARSAGSNPFLG